VAEEKAPELKEEPKGNPQKQDEPKPAKEEPQPLNEGAGKPDPTKELIALKEQHDTLKRQYGASSEEALKLKAQVEELQESLKKLESAKASIPSNDEEFKQRVNEVGYAQAIKEIVDAAVKPIAEQTQSLVNKDVDKILEDFKAKHPGLKDDILAKFDKEFDRFKSVYDTVQEAMDAAYAVIGGVTADKPAETPTKEIDETTQQHEKDKKELAANAGGSPDGTRSTPGKTEAFMDKQIEELRATAIQKEANGRNAEDLWIKLEQLKSERLSKST